MNLCNNRNLILIEILKYVAPWLPRIDIKECRWNYWHIKYLLDTTDLLASIKSCFSVRVNHHFHHVLSLHLSKPVKTAWMIAVSLHSSSVFLWTLIIISICVELRIYLTIHHAITIGIVGWWYNATWFSSINYTLRSLRLKYYCERQYYVISNHTFPFCGYFLSLEVN